jgi:hypothetical protein
VDVKSSNGKSAISSSSSWCRAPSMRANGGHDGRAVWCAFWTSPTSLSPGTWRQRQKKASSDVRLLASKLRKPDHRINDESDRWSERNKKQRTSGVAHMSVSFISPGSYSPWLRFILVRSPIRRWTAFLVELMLYFGGGQVNGWSWCSRSVAGAKCGQRDGVVATIWGKRSR